MMTGPERDVLRLIASGDLNDNDRSAYPEHVIALLGDLDKKDAEIDRLKFILSAILASENLDIDKIKAFADLGLKGLDVRKMYEYAIDFKARHKKDTTND